MSSINSSATPEHFTFGGCVMSATLQPDRGDGAEISLSGNQRYFESFAELLELRLKRHHAASVSLTDNTVKIQSPPIINTQTAEHYHQIPSHAAVRDTLTAMAKQMATTQAFNQQLAEIPELRKCRHNIEMVGTATNRLICARNAAQQEFDRDMAAVKQRTTPLTAKQEEVLFEQYVNRHYTKQDSRGR